MIFRKRKFPRRIEKALAEYKKLMANGCLKTSCEQCCHLIQVDEHHWTCERERLMKILLPKYKEEINKI